MRGGGRSVRCAGKILATRPAEGRLSPMSTSAQNDAATSRTRMGRTRSKADAKPPPRRRAPFACLAGTAAVATAAIGIGGSSSSNFGDDGAIALDAHGLVRLVPGFLRAGEIDALLRLGHTIAELNDLSERYASVELSPPLIGSSSGRSAAGRCSAPSGRRRRRRSGGRSRRGR